MSTPMHTKPDFNCLSLYVASYHGLVASPYPSTNTLSWHRRARVERWVSVRGNGNREERKEESLTRETHTEPLYSRLASEGRLGNGTRKGPPTCAKRSLPSHATDIPSLQLRYIHFIQQCQRTRTLHGRGQMLPSNTSSPLSCSVSLYDSLSLEFFIEWLRRISEEDRV